jgi:uncharacterized glyoxalase superfamily protein PhnB
MTQRFYPTLQYDDAQAAIDFLKAAFGFEELSVMKNEDGTIGHAELVLDGAVVMVSDKQAADARFPMGPNTLYFALDDPDSHHERAVGAGADIVMAPVDQHYGSREYAAKDPGGNVWTFGTYRPEI